MLRFIYLFIYFLPAAAAASTPPPVLLRTTGTWTTEVSSSLGGEFDTEFVIGEDYAYTLPL